MHIKNLIQHEGKLLRVTETLYILTVVAVILLHPFVKIHRTTYLQRVNLPQKL